MGKDTKEEDKLELFMDHDEAAGNYSNYLNVSHNPTEFILDFFSVQGKQGHHSSRVIINAINIKDFAQTLLRNIEKYEKNNEIELPENLSKYLNKGIEKKKNN